MSSHLNLPWEWVECADVNICEKVAHLNINSFILNSYPREWVQQFLPSCEITKFSVKTYDSETGLLHNEHGPAAEWLNGDKAWYFDGELHRVGGPAMKRADGHHGWYRNGELYYEHHENSTCP